MGWHSSCSCSFIFIFILLFISFSTGMWCFLWFVHLGSSHIVGILTVFFLWLLFQVFWVLHSRLWTGAITLCGREFSQMPAVPDSTAPVLSYRKTLPDCFWLRRVGPGGSGGEQGVTLMDQGWVLASPVTVAQGPSNATALVLLRRRHSRSSPSALGGRISTTWASSMATTSRWSWKGLVGQGCARRRAARRIWTRAVRRSWRSETAARARARARRLEARSTAAAARTAHPPPAGRRYTRKCSNPLAPDPTATPMTMPPVPSHVPALIIRWPFAPLLQGK